jgi:manganese/zinc/iron transport system substrate-binding protein
MKLIKSLLFFLTLLILASCGNTANPSGGKKKIVVTTGMVGDAVKNLVGNIAEVEVLMGAGVDPHLYKASQGDMEKLSKADIIVYNGHHLEGKMTEVFEKMRRNKPVIPLAELVHENRYQRAQEGSNVIDPHIWMDIKSWSTGISNLREDLIDLFPNDSAKIESNHDYYQKELIKTDYQIELLMGSIPTNQKVIITSHDAFRYFGLNYGIEVKGLQGISTVSEYGLRDVSDMVNFIVNRKIKAVFIESSVSDKSLQAVIEGCAKKGHQVVIGGKLYSDALGAEGTPEGTYCGMLLHNARTIQKALK